MSVGLNVLLGGVLLVAGRRLFWLFVAGVGFIIGLGLAPRLLPGQPEAVMVIVALICALLGALLAHFLQKTAVGVVGFFAGGWLTLWLLQALALDGGSLRWLAFIVGGIIGIVLLSKLFEWGLVLLSSLVGASLLTEALMRLWPAFAAPMVAFLILFGVGILIQARSLPR